MCVDFFVNMTPASCGANVLPSNMSEAARPARGCFVCMQAWPFRLWLWMTDKNHAITHLDHAVKLQLDVAGMHVLLALWRPACQLLLQGL
jgi:hypothetical protein